MARHGLAGERRGVKLRGPLDDGAVDGHALAGLHDDDGAHGDVVGADLGESAVVALDVGVVGGDVHHGCDRLAALAHGVRLKQLAYLVEQHDGRALGHVGVCVWEQDHGERADCGDGHEEALVEGLSAADVVPGLLEDVMARDEERDEEEHEAHVEGCGLAKERRERAELVCGIDDGKDREREKDAVQLVLLALLLATLLSGLGSGACHGVLQVI